MKNIFNTIILSAFLVLLSLAPAIAQEGADEAEPNDEMDKADSISGTTIQGKVGAKSDEGDWYKLQNQEGFHPFFTLTYDQDKCDIDMDIHSEETLVDSLTSTESPDTLATYVGGACYLHVYSSSGHGDYTIDIKPQVDQGQSEVEPNDTVDLADAIEGYEIYGYACPGDDDWYMLDGSEGENPTISLDYDLKTCDIDLEVYSDEEMAGELTATEPPDSDDFKVPGTCYIHVWAFDGEGYYTVIVEPSGD